MTHIPDEAVQAFIERYEIGCNHRYDENSIRAAIIAAIPYLLLGYEVKQLDWEYNDRPNRTYQTLDEHGSAYYIDQGFGFDSYYFTTIRCADGVVLYDGNDLHKAKAAAQADFERRVRECAVAKPVDVAAVQRQAFEEAAKALDAWGDIYGDNAAACVRALSAEPVQGDQTALTALAQGGG